MQVRAVEFQENFRLVTLEASRQHNLLIRDGADSAQGAASSLAIQRAEDTSRPLPSDRMDPNRKIEEQNTRDQGAQRRGRGTNSGNEESPDPGLQDAPSLGGIDLLA